VRLVSIGITMLPSFVGFLPDRDGPLRDRPGLRQSDRRTRVGEVKTGLRRIEGQGRVRRGDRRDRWSSRREMTGQGRCRRGPVIRGVAKGGGECGPLPGQRRGGLLGGRERLPRRGEQINRTGSKRLDVEGGRTRRKELCETQSSSSLSSSSDVNLSFEPSCDRIGSGTESAAEREKPAEGSSRNSEPPGADDDPGSPTSASRNARDIDSRVIAWPVETSEADRGAAQLPQVSRLHERYEVVPKWPLLGPRRCLLVERQAHLAHRDVRVLRRMGRFTEAARIDRELI
jgi:hypothetical protein